MAMYNQTILKKKHHKLKRNSLLEVSKTRIGYLLLFAITGVVLLALTRANPLSVSTEPEKGLFSDKISKVSDNNASGSLAVRFNQNKGSVVWRNSNPIYTTQPGVASANLDLSKLISGESADPSWFHSIAQTPPTGETGQFRASCVPSHVSTDDAIVFPNQTGAAHQHLFYGNTDSNAFSTSNSIVNSGGSTCAGQEANRTSYWFPTMLDANGKTRIPNVMILYYKGEGVAPPPGGYSAIPQGIKMLAGSSKWVYPNQQPHGFNDGFACGDLFTNPTSDLIPSNPAIGSAGSYVRAPACVGNGADVKTGKQNNLKEKVLFPRCWDGKPIDLNAPTKYPEDTQHVKYPSGYNFGTCPDGYPKVFPEISILFEWELAPGESTQDWHLSSDHDHTTGITQPGGTTRHGDYIAGWNKQVIESWTNKCVNTEWNCQSQFISNTLGDFGVNAGRYPYLKNTNADLYSGLGPIILN